VTHITQQAAGTQEEEYTHSGNKERAAE